MKRTRHEIRADILKVCSVSGALKTEIVYKCNLNFVLAQKHIDALLVSGKLLKNRLNERYYTTGRGFRYVSIVRSLA